MSIRMRALCRGILLVCPIFVVMTSVLLAQVGAIPGQSPKEFAATLSTVTFGHQSGDYIEMVALTPQAMSYVFAVNYLDPSFCSMQSGDCSIVLWGYSGLSHKPSSIAHRNEELFSALIDLNPFQLSSSYPPQESSGATAWFSIRTDSQGAPLHKEVIAEGFYPFDTQNPFYQVYDYMRSLKKDIIFLSQEFNLRACVKELEDPVKGSTFGASPHWKEVKLAMISYLAQNRYEPARPVFERLLKSETDAQILARLKAAQRLFAHAAGQTHKP